MTYEAFESPNLPGQWVVRWGGAGSTDMVVFDCADAQIKAREYATWKNGRMDHPTDAEKQDLADKIVALMRTIDDIYLDDVMGLVADHFCPHCWTDFGDGPVGCPCMRDD